MAYFDVRPTATAAQGFGIHPVFVHPIPETLAAEAVVHPMPATHWGTILLENQAGPIGLANWDGRMTTPALPGGKNHFFFAS